MVLLPPGVHFTVGLSQDTTFVDREIIKFDKVITNTGGGYIDDVNNTDYGKFIAPQNGTYQFNANFYYRKQVIEEISARTASSSLWAIIAALEPEVLPPSWI